MVASYPTSIATWTDRVDNVNYVYAADPNAIIAEVLAIAKDLVGTGGTAGGLAQGGTSFYARWTQEHNTSGTHKAINCTTITASGAISTTGLNASGLTASKIVLTDGSKNLVSGVAYTNASTASTVVLRDANKDFSAHMITSDLTGNVTGDLTGNADTATTSPNHSGTYAHNQAVATTSSPTFAAVTSGTSALKWKVMTGTLDGSGRFAHGLTLSDILHCCLTTYVTASSVWVSDGSYGETQSYAVAIDATYVTGTYGCANRSYRAVIFYV